MIMRTIFFLLATVAMYAQDASVLLRQTPAPSAVAISHAATFWQVDRAAFDMARALPDNGIVNLSIVLPKIGSVEVVAARYRVMEPSAQVVAVTKSGPMVVPQPQSVLLRGKIKGMEGAFVVLALYPEWSTGMITVPTANGAIRYRLSPLPNLTGSEAGTLILYDDADVPTEGGGWTCATPEPKGLRIPTPKVDERSQAVQYRKITLAIECDEPFYIDHGSNITKATQYAEAVVAASSALYERDVEATLSIGSLLVWTTADPYPGTTSDALLVQFRDRWRSLNAGVDRTLAHLLSGVNNIGGIAYVDRLCNKQFGYAVSGTNNNVTYPAAGYVWDTDVISHELGHNIGSPHTHSCTWNPPIDSCYTAEGGCYTGTKATKGTIMSYCHLTAQGTELVFNNRVVALMKTKLTNSACTPLVSFFGVDMPASLDVCRSRPASVTADVVGATGTVVYRWLGGGIDTTTQTATLTFVPQNTFTLRCTVTDGAGAIASDSTRINVFQLPRPQLEVAINRVCKGTVVEILSTTINGRPPYKYKWLLNNVVADTSNDKFWPRIDSTSRIRLVVTDQGGCSDTAETFVYVPDQRLTMAPNQIALQSLPPCIDRIEQDIALRNFGTEDILIDSARSRRGTPFSLKTPIVIPASTLLGSSIVIRPSSVGQVRDTIDLFSRFCDVKFSIPVSFVRTEAKVVSALPVDFGTKLICKDTVEYSSDVRIDNRSDVAISISAVRGRTMGTNVQLVGGPIDIAPRESKLVTVIAPGRRIGGVENDSLTFSYSANECEGSITVAAILRTIGMTIDHPANVSFDTVYSNAPARTRSFNISTTLIGAPKIAVTGVVVDGPFTTTLRPGTELVVGKPTVVSVSLVPQEFQSDGLVTGAIRFTLDSCPTERVIEINALLRTVSVSEERTSEQPITEGTTDVFDIRGAAIRVSVPIGDVRELVESLPRGVYLIVSRSSDGTKTHVRRITSH